MTSQSEDDIFRIIQSANPGYQTLSDIIRETGRHPRSILRELRELESNGRISSMQHDGVLIWYISDTAEKIEMNDFEFRPSNIISIDRAIRYEKIIAGLALVSVFVLYSSIMKKEPSGLLLSAGAFYTTIGIYVFSQANSVYSIAATFESVKLHEIATEISASAYLLTAGAATHFLLGVIVIAPLNGIFGINVSHTPEDMLVGVGVFLASKLILYATYKHAKVHRWFADIKPIYYE